MAFATGTRVGPYEIVGWLGAGGMGEVYRARDQRLGREVAIKVIPETFATDANRVRRFEQEARSAGQLNHPNILTVYDVGTHEGAPYIVSELLEGESLRSWLHEAPPARRKAIDFARQIAEGLAAAHDKGIVHRDLKPDNLFVTSEGRIKILDFGLAKLTQPAEDASRGTGQLTETGAGTVMGTAGYMSPEQVRGETVDHRSDIFSFGAVLYEMLTGHPAFTRGTAAETMVAILKEDLPELSSATIPPALARIVTHSLEKTREARFQSARDLAFGLESLSTSSPAHAGAGLSAASRTGMTSVLVAAAAIVLAVGGLLLMRRPPKTAAEAIAVKRVAVLPFENLGSAEDDYFADGIADEVRGKLTSLPGVEVIARSSSTPYKKTTKTANQIARELDVEYLLTATVRWQKTGDASRVQVRPELVEVRASGAPASKWQQPFDAALTDVFQVQSDIASRVAQALGVALGAREEKQLSEKPTGILAAYDAFLKGEEAWNSGSGPQGLRKALGFYERAVALDPDFAQAWARVSQASSTLCYVRTLTRELAERARQAAETAAALAPNRPEECVALGDYYSMVVRDPTRALKEYVRGLRLAPSNAEILTAIALVERSLGRWDAVLMHFREAERLDPRSMMTHWRYGQALLFLRRHREAREVLDRSLVIAPANIDVIETKAMTFLAEGDLAEARSVLKAAPKEVDPTALVANVATDWDLVWVLDDAQRELLLRLTPNEFDGDRGIWGLVLAQAYALQRDPVNVRSHAEEARQSFEEHLRARPEDAPFRLLLGLSLAYLGRKDEAIREGERGVALEPIAKDAYTGAYYQHLLARIYILAGEPEKALDQLEPLLKIPYYLSPGWLEIDPYFDPLRRNPRFLRLLAVSK